MAAATAADSDPTAVATSACAHCQRDIPSSNIDLHSAHCARNLQKCEHCGEMVARKLMDEHYNENHAPVNCSLCKETLHRTIWDLHKSEQCPQRIIACEYCEFELPAVDLHEHQDVCGNRTEFCQTCKKYIRLREWIGHEMQCHVNSNCSAESSSQRDIPSSNIDLHSAHCARNLQKCEHCGEMVARKLMDEHYNENHAPVNCSLCKETLHRTIWDLHKSEQCPQRIIACEYCEFELPAVDLHEHQDVCGNRTEFCQTCKKYIRLREWVGHEMQCHVNSNGSAESSSARTIPEREVRPPPPVRPARPAHGSQHKRLLFTIAVTGIAVMIGSILFQREESI